MAEVEQLRGELAEARARIGFLEKLVDEDPLMPVVNRRAFVRELTRMLAFAQRYAVPASILYFDVNNMKQINDVHGHAAGDAALVAMAQVLIENVRTTDVVGRLGGDEMGVLLVQADQALAERKAGRACGAHRGARDDVAARSPFASPSPAAPMPLRSGDSAGEIIDAADRAMYRAKATMKQRRTSALRASGDDVGQQFRLELDDEILERELALLQALQVQMIGRHLFREPRNRLVEVAMLALERLDLRFQGFDVEIHDGNEPNRRPGSTV